MIGRAGCFLPHRARQGFTLIELIIAIAIFSLIGLSSTLILNGVLTANETSVRHGDVMANMQRGLLFMRRDFEQIQARGITDEFGNEQAAVLGQDFVVEFTHNGWSNPLPDVHRRSSLQRVRYLLEEDALVREYWPVLDRAQNSLPLRAVLLRSIKRFVVRYYDAEDKQWLEQWPPLAPERKKDLPAVIEVLVESETLGEIRRLYGTVGEGA